MIPLLIVAIFALALLAYREWAHGEQTQRREAAWDTERRALLDQANAERAELLQRIQFPYGLPSEQNLEDPSEPTPDAEDFEPDEWALVGTIEPDPMNADDAT